MRTSSSKITMIPITGKDLLAEGFTEGAELGKALRFSQDKLAQGLGRDSILTQAKALFLRSKPPKLSLRRDPLEVSIACTVDNSEEESNLQLSLDRIREISKLPVVEGVSLMPDNCPTGSEWGSIPVGGAVITSHHILPAAHSADINCGMSLSFFESEHNTGDLMGALKNSCLFGPGGAPPERQISHPVLMEDVWSNPFLKGLEETAMKCLGTQGDGNHFSSIGAMTVTMQMFEAFEEAGQENLVKALSPWKGRTLHTLVTHHGSRQLGAQVYRRGIKQAEVFTRKVAEGIPKNGSWLDIRTPEGHLYKQALDYVGRWTEVNHQVVHDRFLKTVGGASIGRISNHHNAVWFHRGRVYHGKGATPAWKLGGKGQIGIIPLNMGSSILLVSGLDNEKFLSFAPHGAGRNKSRSALKREFLNPDSGQEDPQRIAEALERSTQGVKVIWASGEADISESPLGYKSAEKIKAELEKFGLAKTIAEITPRGCMMAGGGGWTRNGNSFSKGLSRGRGGNLQENKGRGCHQILG